MNSDDLFGVSLNDKMSFLEDKKKTSGSIIYGASKDKLKDPSKGWRSVLRLLPNFKPDGTLGESAITNTVNSVYISNPEYRSLGGVFDSPENFGEPSKLSKLYWTLKDSKNAMQVERSRDLKKYTNYFSYALVMEDDQQPELVGKIVIFRYGITIANKIKSEDTGEITGERCNVFDPLKGKDFVFLVRYKDNDNNPDYSNCTFRPNPSPMSIYSKEKGEFKQIPVDENGNVDKKYGEIVKKFLLDREHDLDEVSPKPLTEEQNEKIDKIVSYMTTGKVEGFGDSSNEFGSSDSASSMSLDDFESSSDSSDDMDDMDDDDDFFNGL